MLIWRIWITMIIIVIASKIVTYHNFMWIFFSVIFICCFVFFIKEIEGLCVEGFSDNTTAIGVCKTKVKDVIIKIRDCIDIAEAPEVICQKLHVC